MITFRVRYTFHTHLQEFPFLYTKQSTKVFVRYQYYILIRSRYQLLTVFRQKLIIIQIQKIRRFLKQDYNENMALVKLTLHEKETQLHVKKNLLSPNWL